MSRSSIFLIVVFALFAAAPARADEGMWLLNRPPTRLLKERYNFEPSPAWLEHIQKSCVRFGDGGSGSIVSADGLVMTNHHVGSDMLQKLSTPQHDLLKTGFRAKSRSEEPKCPDLELLALWTMEDVTDKVNAGITNSTSAADAMTTRRKNMATLEQESKSRTGLHAQVVTLYHGARYHLYCYKRYTDIRLVFAPEQQIAFYGGDNDNFEYPRFDLDCCFFRIYENDKPLKPEHHLKWSKAGAADNELTFVFGHPGRTQRLFTVDHLKLLRDVEIPFMLQRFWRSEVRYGTFAGRSDEFDRIIHEDILGAQNARKAYTGIIDGLLDPALFAAKADAEKKLRDAVAADAAHKTDWSGAWDRIAAAEHTYREFYKRYQLLERRPALSCDLYRIARTLVRLAEEKAKPSGERLREFRDSELESLYLQLYSPAPIYDDLEIEKLAGGLALLAETFGGDDPLVVKALAGMPPRARGEALIRGTTVAVNASARSAASQPAADGDYNSDGKVDGEDIQYYLSHRPADKSDKGAEALARHLQNASPFEITGATLSFGGSKLKDVAFRKKLAEGGTQAIADCADPLIRLAALIDPDARAARKRYEDEVESVERENYAKIAAAQFAQAGEKVYPDATFTLRMALGPIKGYTENGQQIPPFTTFGGLYERARERHDKPPFDLPPRWVERKNSLNLKTPFNFVCTADIIGGNSGSPVVNKAGEVIGLIFDGNLQSLIWDIAFTDEQGRAVAVDSRALIEAIRKVYDANDLADELTRE